jgi:hypothetical protein
MADIISVLLARKALLLDQVELAQAEFKHTISRHQQEIEQLQSRLSEDRKRINAVLGDLKHMVELGDWIDQYRLLRGDEPMPWPRFRFGERVSLEYHCPDRQQTFVDVGVVVGMAYGRPDRSPGWWYDIKWVELQSSPRLPLPHFDEAYEDELKAIAHVDDFPLPCRCSCQPELSQKLS